jgi:hypothetical protein
MKVSRLMVISAVIVIVVIGLCCWVVLRPRSADALPETAVKQFCASFFDSAPPNDPNGASAKAAMALLTAPALSDIGEAKAPSFYVGLAEFAGVRKTPEGGVTIDVTVQSDDAAFVKATFNYRKGPITKAFYLKLVDGKWKIDSIKAWATI